MKGFLNRLANNEKEGSLADRLRKKRFDLFRSLISDLPRPIRIVDVGGTVNYWQKMGLLLSEEVEITLVNLHQSKVAFPNIKSHKGDARNLSEFEDNSFDIAFSNSVIEHVGNYQDQTLMVKEMQRLAPRLYLQTPNYYFPLEPHFLFPFFQFLPLRIKVWLIMNFQLGWYPRLKKREDAVSIAKSITLLKFKEIRDLFPNAKIFRERFVGLTKSFVVIEGF
ncbi:MAG: methyltransferase type 11 [Bacteroidetes bacterium HGW-Bacteroidetes-15]|nr:MAG: methyltransferase type 11 [Bacteroidetes bacterium HGW-Bacteroidetes-15]